MGGWIFLFATLVGEAERTIGSGVFIAAYLGMLALTFWILTTDDAFRPLRTNGGGGPGVQ